MLRLEQVGRTWRSGARALNEVSFAVARGACVALLGPSGCGKSTLLRLIAGLDRPDDGAIVWDGGSAPAPGRIGMVFQDPVLLPWASARDNAALPLRLGGASRKQADAAARDGLAELGLADFADALPRALSGGMRMRVALARALSTRPDLLLLDEPFAALDEPARHRLQAALRELYRARGCTTVLVTHSIYEAAFVAETVVVLSERPGTVRGTLNIPPHTDRLDPAYLESVARVTRAMRP